MPYKSVAELPDSTKKMPAHAKRIFLSAFNSASKQYDDESRAFAVAFAAVKKLYRQDKDGRWHRIKEAQGSDAKGYPAKRRKKAHEWNESDAEPLDADTDAWLTGVMPEIEQAALTEDMEYHPGQEARRQGIMSLSHLLSCADHLSLADGERTSLTTILSRLSADIQSDASGMDEGEPIDLDAAQDVAEQDLVSRQLGEAGQRHRDEDYHDFDTIMNLIKKLRGVSPKELSAERQAAADAESAAEAARQANSPEGQVQAGYHAGEPEDEPETAPELAGVAESISLQESMTFLREAGSDGRSWQVSVIEAGLSKNNRRYSLDVLRQAAPLFEGARVYVYDRLLKGKEVYDHLSDEEYRANPRGYAKDLVGYLKSPLIEGSRLVATLMLLPSADWLRDNLREASKQGQVGLYGLSIDADGDGHWVESGGSKILEVDSIKSVTSVDVVSFPAAGGKFMRLVASVGMAEAELHVQREVESGAQSLQYQMGLMRFREDLNEKLDDLGIPVVAKRQFRQWLLSALP